MVETVSATNRSAGISYQDLLATDSRTVPDHLSDESPLTQGPSRIPTSVYFSPEFHDLEVEKLWSRVWQLACHEDELVEVGDYVVYDIAHLSYLLVRTGEASNDIQAYRNSCLHRGRKLREQPGKRARTLDAAFMAGHGNSMVN